MITTVPRRKRKRSAPRPETVPVTQFTTACLHGDHDACTCACDCHTRQWMGHPVLGRVLATFHVVADGLQRAAEDRTLTILPAKWTMESLALTLAHACDDLAWTQPDWSRTPEFQDAIGYVATYLRPYLQSLAQMMIKTKWTEAQTRQALTAGLALALTPNRARRHYRPAKKEMTREETE